MNSKSKRIFIISGPSAVGKDAIVERILKTDLPLKRMVTTTSRPRRADDQRLKYHYVTADRFRWLIDHGKMIEWVQYNENYYGTQWADLDKIFALKKYPLLNIEVRGAEFYRTNFPKAISIFILPSSISILRKRLEKRGTKETDIRDRLKTAQKEIRQAPKFNYRVINYDGKLENVVAEVAKLIKQRIR